MDAGAQDIAHFPKQIDWIGELVREAVDRVGGGEVDTPSKRGEEQAWRRIPVI